MALVGAGPSLGSSGPSAASEPTPCEADGRYRQLDFLVGEWRVVDSGGTELGSSRIVKQLGGCLIEETWVPRRGAEGRGRFYFDPAAGGWRQHRADASGGVEHYEGQLLDGSIRFNGRRVRPDGTVIAARVVLAASGNGRVHHLVEHSADGGSWHPYFDAIYIPADEPPSAEKPPERRTASIAPEATRRPADAELDRTVRAVSRETPHEQIPLDDKPQTHMSSPMTLELVLGQIDLYAEGTEWSSKETAAYVCNGVTVRRVAVSKRRRRGDVLLELSFTLQAERLGRIVDLTLELVSEGEVVGRATIERVNLGRLVSAYDRGTEMMRSSTLRLAAEQFEALFRDGRRPTLRVTANVSS